ncbi:hypothetical protein Z959_12845 [Clostridium novyi B str. ATCC 27606]|uniref:Uncharacterized protein n=2 Tax=Clostridium TaxID=1485 RepID=A0AA40IRT1_CLONO|nr:MULTISPECIES: hypothetical protein [Clostridium]KEI08566.1 hypothetical protein Z958_12885 [Clostridium novyi B str. NCTC 9691]KEI11977.1 hypothetical protein Z959_12845 [Clostridium novyi B str. ATCC 27606]KEI14468.1 hypothetical protein Z960_12510 [Clostridium haemolyticum NCTC 9693]KGM98762.1 hypothetical protein Z961_12170 [Clostridium haemolyticum NCTC 8350]CAG7839600.1 hypothetical protein CLOHAE12215_01013 [Clostridium haemolyticum]
MNSLYCTKNNFCTCMSQYANENNFMLEVKNNGFFNAQIVFTYLYAGEIITEKRYNILYGNTCIILYPKNSYQVSVSIYNESVLPKAIVCRKIYPVGKNIRLLLWGTATATNCTEPNIFNSNYENLCQCCCRQAMNNCILNCIK